MSATVDFKRILFATDFGPGATNTLPYVLSLAVEHRAKVVFLHMVPPMPISDIGPVAYCPPMYMAEEVTRWEATQRQESAKKLRALVPSETKLPYEPEYVVATNFTPGGILTVAADHNVDLIAMGANRTESARSAAHLPWTVVHHVISEARCPVLTAMA
jgi:nucleotide-binding universal stress UspA family protein